jgi:hypothetical protein
VLDWNAAVLALIPVVAGGIGWLVVRSYQRADERQARMIDLYKTKAAEAEQEREQAEADAKRAWAKARAYWRLLVEHNIEPVPPIEDGDEI